MGRHGYANTNARGGHRRGGYYNEHDDRNEGQQNQRRNRVWNKDGRHVSFNDRGGGGAVRKRYTGPRGGGGAANLGVPRIATAGAAGVGDRLGRGGGNRLLSGKARPPSGPVRSKYGRRGLGRGGGHVGRSFAAGAAAAAAAAAASVMDGTGEWHKVVLANAAARLSKEAVLRALTASLRGLAPICFTKLGMNFVFHVESRAQALQLADLDAMINVPDASADGGTVVAVALSIRVEPSPPPQMTLTDEVMYKIKTVMSSRYTPATRALDLRSFHSDPGFLGEPIYAPLYRGALLKKVAEVVRENIPEVEAVDISENRIPNFDGLQHLATCAPNIKILYMSRNRLTEPVELAKLVKLKLIDLRLDGNPLTLRFKEDGSRYIKFVRKIFPTLKVLDERELPKVIGFEGDDPGQTGSGPGEGPALPDPVMKFCINPNAEPVILQFLQEYFKVFDSPGRNGREALISAYHEEALMSMSCSARLSQKDKVTEYLVRSRNLMRVQDPARRNTLLKKGRLSIVSFLSELPPTTHDLASFTLDVPLASDKLMTFTVTGVFREEVAAANRLAAATADFDGGDGLRHFSRTFAVVPQGSGFCIVNEVMHVTAATKFQVQNAFKSGGVAGEGSTGAPPDGAAAQFGLINSVAQSTGMNQEWSKKCLEQTNWNLDAAVKAFNVAREEGKIPIEAYEK